MNAGVAAAAIPGAEEAIVAAIRDALSSAADLIHSATRCAHAIIAKAGRRLTWTERLAVVLVAAWVRATEARGANQPTGATLIVGFVYALPQGEITAILRALDAVVAYSATCVGEGAARGVHEASRGPKKHKE